MFEKEILILKEKINKSKNILLINHKRMDPDAFGSLSTFYYILRDNLNKNVLAINDDERPDNFAFLDEKNIFKNKIENFNPDLIISFDVASIDQLGEVYNKNKDIFDKFFFVVIDHHITNPWFWDLNIIDTKASSTCELVFYILEKLDFLQYINKKIATFLNAWMLTDTNMYYNQNTTPKTLCTAAKLMEYWSDYRAPIFEFFKKKSFSKTKLFGIALQKIQKKWDIAYSFLTKDDFLQANAKDQDTNWIIDMMINIEWINIAFLVYALDKWDYKVSFRSKEFNVGKFCEQFWGWGHKLASWFSTQEIDPQKIIDKILFNLNKWNK